MHAKAIQKEAITNDQDKRLLKGAIHILIRTFPLLFEDKELLMRCMWREQALFGNQNNALKMMESISLLLFKPGYTVQEVSSTLEL